MVVAGWHHGTESGARAISRQEVLGIIVRMASVQLAPERIDEILRRYREIVRPVHQRSEGLRNHYVLVHRPSGQMRLIGLWDSQEALEMALPTLEPAVSGCGRSSGKIRPWKLTRLLTRSESHAW
jgi:hypothetical protein